MRSHPALATGNVIDGRYIVQRKWNRTGGPKREIKMWELFDLRTGDVLYVTWRGLRALFGGWRGRG